LKQSSDDDGDEMSTDDHVAKLHLEVEAVKDEQVSIF
jgi:hypothetical protein